MSDARVQVLHDVPPRKGDFVLYWMQQSQRHHDNHALEYSVEQANALDLPVVVCFGLMDDYPEANERHYAFMVQGLAEVDAGLRERGILFVVRHGAPPAAAIALAPRAATIVTDRGYLPIQRRWRDQVADAVDCRVVQVESDVVVPVEAASDKHESAARTLRPKIHKLLPQYLQPVKTHRLKHPSLNLRLKRDIDVSDPAAAVKKLKLDRGVGPTKRFQGGPDQALKLLGEFLAKGVHGYAKGRNEPAAMQTSKMAAYLHFGQVSPLRLALSVRDCDAPKVDRDAYLEELIIRRELSMNFVHFETKFDQFDCIPNWAMKTLAEHAKDKRPHDYSRSQLEHSQTHDPYWNAAMTELRETGFMHNYMRMYWGKKFIEWKASPAEAYEDLLHLNNKYFLCGRDANSFANVSWIFGLHDRPWATRPIFGMVRYMNAAGLERKFDIEAYVRKVGEMVGKPE